MASLPTQSFNVIVSNTIAGIQGRAAKLINFSTGSTLRAIVEGFAGLFLWLQSMVLQLLQATRLSTSSGNDVDTFTVDFMPALPGSVTAALPNGSPRLGPQNSTGQLTFARFTAGASSCFVPAATSVSAVGVVVNAGPNAAATVKSNDGTQSFVVTVDPRYSSYSAGLGGYTMPSSIGSLIVPAQALVPGSAGNVSAGAISVITSGNLTGIDTVNNVAAFVNGANQESDSALKARFAAYILGLSRGDIFGLTAAILGAEVNIQWTLTEGYNLDGSYHPGYFFVVADDGSGAPTAAFLQIVTNAANAVRPLSIQFGVFSPIIINATPSLQIKTAAGYDHSTVVAQVAATIAANINALGLGNSLPANLVSTWAYSVAGVTAVTAVLLNGLPGDAATLSATKLTQDGNAVIGCFTIKCASVIVS